MIARPAGRQWRDPAKAEAAKIKLIHENIDHPNRIVFTDPVIQPFGKQCALAAVFTLNETLHQKTPDTIRRILADLTFLHSLGQ